MTAGLAGLSAGIGMDVCRAYLGCSRQAQLPFIGAAEVESRMMSSPLSVTLLAGSPGSLMRCLRSLAAAAPIARIGCETVVNAGATTPANSISSYPVTLIAPGTSMPSSCSTESTPIARTAFPQQMAVGRTSAARRPHVGRE